jgi:hypothetical protein
MDADAWQSSGAWQIYRHGHNTAWAWQKNAKKSEPRQAESTPPPSRKVGFASGRGAKNLLRTLSPCVSEPFCIFAKTLTMKKPIIMKSISNGLDVRGGRLINNRPCSINGIQRAAQLKSDMKREKKVSMIAEGIRRAEMESELGYQMLTTMPIKRR